ncbi:MAG: carboxypeptidase-like regulatory domain-containing protein [Geopsychrobacter sp.]|nr:carboxypeptidase-like regulatory domain-containing protein [Geopsychrobacter sp.]
MRNLFIAVFFLLLLPSTLLAATGVKGRVAWRGQLIPGVQVRAYTAIDMIAAGKVFAISDFAAQDGTYTLELPPGRYYLTARNDSGTPGPGDYFCYYSGAPVIVPQQGFRQVGFNLIQIPQTQHDKESRRSGIWGEIRYQGQPLERTYLYVYKKTESDFKGPAWFIQPVEKGSFRMSLPPGDYWLLARKRLKGGQYGPIEIGDYFNYYYGNPVHIEKNRLTQVKLETITRLSMLEDDPDAVFSGIGGRVVGPQGAAVSGVRVFAYRSSTMTGTPAYISPVTSPDGSFVLPIPEMGNFWLLARQAIGGPAVTGELYGKFQTPDNRGLQLTATRMSKEVQINVSAHP